MFCFYPRGLAAMRKCQVLVYALGCWQSDKGRVPKEPCVTWPCWLRHHRATAPGLSCCLCHHLPQQPWACLFASVSLMVGAENIQIHLPARSRGGEHCHGGLNATMPWQGPTARGYSPCAKVGPSLAGCKSASCTPSIPVHSLLGGTGAPAPEGRGPKGCHPHTEKGTRDMAEHLPNIQPLGFPAVKTHQVPALNTTLLHD